MEILTIKQLDITSLRLLPNPFFLLLDMIKMTDEKKLICGLCEHIDFTTVVKRYMDTLYPCSKYDRLVMPHEECYKYKLEKLKPPMKTEKNYTPPDPVEKVLKPKKKRRKKIIPKPEPPIQEPVEVNYVISTPPPVQKEVIPLDELTPEEKKAIKRQALEAQIAELEATE